VNIREFLVLWASPKAVMGWAKTDAEQVAQSFAELLNSKRSDSIIFAFKSILDKSWVSSGVQDLL
jgi:hypothetical protein